MRRGGGGGRCGRCGAAGAAALRTLPWWVGTASVDWGSYPCDKRAALTAARKAFAPAGYDEMPWGHDLPDPFLEFCFRDEDPSAWPEFAVLATGIFGRALTFFRDKDGSA